MQRVGVIHDQILQVFITIQVDFCKLNGHLGFTYPAHPPVDIYIYNTVAITKKNKNHAISAYRQVFISQDTDPFHAQINGFFSPDNDISGFYLNHDIDRNSGKFSYILGNRFVHRVSSG